MKKSSFNKSFQKRGDRGVLRIGIIGCGKIAQVRHIPEYQENPNTEVVGYYDLNQERASALADQFGGKAYKSLDELLANPEIDAVSVCVANIGHAEASIKALQAGKHVLCEKPMATTLKDCEAMVSEADKLGKKLFIDQNQRLAKAHIRAKELLKEGLIGEVLTFRTSFGHGGPETWSIDPGAATWFFDRTKSAMGAMADLGVHKTDLIQYLLDRKVVATTAQIKTLDKVDFSGKKIGVDDNAICIYEMDGGVFGTMTASWTYYGEEDNSTVLYGSKGIMKIYDDPQYSIKVVLRNGEKINYEVDRIQTNDKQTSTGIIDQFVRCITEGIEPEISGRDVLNAMKAVFASIRSSEEGKRIEL